MKSDELGILQKLKKEFDRLEAQMDDILTKMESTSSQEQRGEAWDAFTEKFLELQGDQRAIIERLSRASAALRSRQLSNSESAVSATELSYEDQPAYAAYAKPPEPDKEVLQTFCGT